jgi:tetratricopeptide (TPR) repeat protein
VDTVNLARDTLKSGMGDCDDLTVLYDSILEALAVDTGFITVPGHIFAAINSKVASRDYRKVHPDRGMSVDVDGELWVPVEITLIGKSGFLEAWRKGMEEWSQYDAAPEKRNFTVTKKAHELYRPVGLKEADLGLQYGRKEAIVEGFRKDRDKLMERMVGEQVSAAQTSGRKEEWNKAGIAYAQFLQYREAEDAFRRAIAMDAGYASARINLGNLLFLRQKYEEALAAYQDARAEIEKAEQPAGSTLARLMINISRTYYQMEKYAEAKDYFTQASAVDPERVKEYAYLAGKAEGSTRATQQRDPAREIIFIDD